MQVANLHHTTRMGGRTAGADRSAETLAPAIFGRAVFWRMADPRTGDGQLQPTQIRPPPSGLQTANDSQAV